MHDLQSLETQRDVLKRELAELEDMRQGHSLSATEHVGSRPADA